jgi:hypothetical protein
MPEIIADCFRFAAFCCSMMRESRYLKHLVLIPLPLAREARGRVVEESSCNLRGHPQP